MSTSIYVVATMETKGQELAFVLDRLDDCVKRIDAIAAAGRVKRSDVIIWCHGGPQSPWHIRFFFALQAMIRFHCLRIRRDTRAVHPV